MIILHLLSNWKWTERAEPAALLARAQARAGVTVYFVCDQGPGDLTDTVADQAKALGLSVLAMRLPKHARFPDIVTGIRDLRAHVARLKPVVVHCHMENAHVMAGIACCRHPVSPCLIRSCYDPDGHELGWRARFVRRPAADGMMVIDHRARQRMETLGMAPERVAVIEPGIDLERFRPDRQARDAARQRWNLAADDFVIGMVTRIRRTRRADLAVSLPAALRETLPQARVLLVGRGTDEAVRRIVTEPAGRLGLGDRLIVAGYQSGHDLVTAYHAMDVLLYPCPGTDASCRTVREAMAAGLPVVAGNTGFLPSLIEDGITGFLTDLSVAALTASMRRLARDPDRRNTMANAALNAARTRFDLTRQAERSLEFYRTITQTKRIATGRW